MSGSVGETASKLSEGTENSVFGVSIMNGFHSMTLTVSTVTTNNTAEGDPANNVTTTNFTLSDQGTFSGTDEQGNLTFKSIEELDAHLVKYLQDYSDSRTRGGHKFPAQVEIHQVQEPE